MAGGHRWGDGAAAATELMARAGIDPPSCDRPVRGATVKGPRGHPPGLVGWMMSYGPSEGPALTRLRYGVRGRDKEVPTLAGGSRPTSDCFLRSDLSNLWLQTSLGSCTKRAGEQRRLPPLGHMSQRLPLLAASQYRHHYAEGEQPARPGRPALLQALRCRRVAMLATSRRPLTTARTTAMMCRPPLVTVVLKTSPSTLVDRMAPM